MTRGAIKILEDRLVVAMSAAVDDFVEEEKARPTLGDIIVAMSDATQRIGDSFELTEVLVARRAAPTSSRRPS